MAIDSQQMGQLGRLAGDPQLRGHFGRIQWLAGPLPSAGVVLPSWTKADGEIEHTEIAAPCGVVHTSADGEELHTELAGDAIKGTKAVE